MKETVENDINDWGLGRFVQQFHWKTYFSESEIKAKLKELKMGTREWVRAGGEINVARGCPNNCAYCYAKKMLAQFGTKDYDDWKNVEILLNVTVPKRIKHDPTKYDFMMQSSTDIPQDKIGWGVWLSAAKDVLENGNTLLITTKPRMSDMIKIHENLSAYKDLFTLRFTITSNNDQLLAKMEPNASRYPERLSALRFMNKLDYNTTVSIEPLLDKSPIPIIMDIQSDLTEINKQKDIGTIWVGLLKPQFTLISYREKCGLVEIYKTIKRYQSFENILGWYKQIYNHPRVIMKESVKRVMLLHNIIIK